MGQAAGQRDSERNKGAGSKREVEKEAAGTEGEREEKES